MPTWLDRIMRQGPLDLLPLPVRIEASRLAGAIPQAKRETAARLQRFRVERDERLSRYTARWVVMWKAQASASTVVRMRREA